jgi:hypothetical protein
MDERFRHFFAGHDCQTAWNVRLTGFQIIPAALNALSYSTGPDREGALAMAGRHE